MRRLDFSFRHAWSLGAPYWRSEERWRARALLAAIVAVNLGLVAITVELTFWQRAFYNALEAKDWSAFIALLLWWRRTPGEGFVPGFGPLLAVFVLLTVYALYMRLALQIRWRRWLTEEYLAHWFADRVYHRVALTDPGTDNPDQRIAEDVRLFVDNTLILGLGLLRSTATLLSFVTLLWSLSQPLTLGGVTVHGYLVWVALLYAGFGTWLTHLVGHPLIALNYAEQKVEADFRFGLMRFRENAEGVAFYGGEADEKRDLSRCFGAVVDNWRAIMAVTRRLTFLTTGFGQLALVFPLAVVAPAYFSGRIPLGAIFQTSSAFVQVQTALSWFVDNYSLLTGWFATVGRLTGFSRSIALARERKDGPSLSGVGARELTLGRLVLTLPGGRTLLRGDEVRISPGERVMLVGATGCGKSTLLRAIAGIWPFGSGSVEFPGGRRLFLPQRPYLPLGKLKRAICYPSPEESLSDQQVITVLDEVGLGHLADRLGDFGAWERCLSIGEQQRVALARALLLRPDWLFLDEATASLDPISEERFYTLLQNHLPRSTIVSIAHRESVARFHHRTLRIENGAVTG
jgi:putative ATP-binding cassette transporter